MEMNVTSQEEKEGQDDEFFCAYNSTIIATPVNLVKEGGTLIILLYTFVSLVIVINYALTLKYYCSPMLQVNKSLFCRMSDFLRLS